MAEAGGRGRATVLTAASQVVALFGSTALGLLLAVRYGADERTDGFFAANSIYALTLFAAQSLRTTAPATLVRGPRALAEHAHAAALMAGVGCVVLLMVLVLGPVVVSEGSLPAFRLSLLLLLPSVAAQFVAGLLAARLAVLDHFVAPAVAFAVGTATMAATFLPAASVLGVPGAALAVTCGTGVTAVILVMVWRRAETTAPIDSRDAEPVKPGRLAGRLLVGAVPVLSAQALMSVSVVAAGQLVVGGATLFSYAMLAVGALNAAVASPVSIVNAADVARAWDRDVEELRTRATSILRLGTAILVPLVAVALLVGPPIAPLLLVRLPPEDIRTIFVLVAIVAPSVAATLFSMLPLVAAAAMDRLGRLGAWSAAGIAGHAVLVAALVAQGLPLWTLGASVLVSASALAAAPSAAVFGGRAPRALALALLATLRTGGPSVVAGLGAWVLLSRATPVVAISVTLAIVLAVSALVLVTTLRRGPCTA